MKASGNAAPETCVQNLLKTIRGEVPYERIKGIDRTLIDKPSGTAANDLAADVEALAGVGIVKSPDYWKSGGGYADANVVCLLHAMAAYVRGK